MIISCSIDISDKVPFEPKYLEFKTTGYFRTMYVFKNSLTGDKTGYIDIQIPSGTTVNLGSIKTVGTSNIDNGYGETTRVSLAVEFSTTKITFQSSISYNNFNLEQVQNSNNPGLLTASIVIY